ncbi:MAG TPA: hypothetical protein VET66_12540 [Steroidobacteraceae bacterium]|nr:hypothetical protein [Steroidobacteraceae bacterium]
MTPDCPELVRFVHGETDAAAFPHREHVRMAFEMLRRHDFAESVWLFSRALRAMVARAGKPQAFNQTVTIAFLALIAERMESRAHADFAAFASHNPEVFDKAVLARWYPRERLAADLARRIFVLPEPPRAASATAPPAGDL